MRKSNLQVCITELVQVIQVSVRSKDSDGSVQGDKAHRLLIAPEIEMAMLIMMTSIFFIHLATGELWLNFHDNVLILLLCKIYLVSE